MEDLEISEEVRIPLAAIEVRSVRSSGPGGQNVNKVASKIELYVDVAAIEGLTEESLARLTWLAGRKLDSGGRLRITAQKSRDRHRNLEDARAKLVVLVQKALQAPKKRRPTRPSAGAREARIAQKKRDSKLKATRRLPGESD